MESPPSSPGVSPPQLKDCIEELLQFTLLSSKQGKLDTGLSDEYCAHLLKSDPLDPFPATDRCEGVPLYPLYKRLALSLYKSIHSGALYAPDKELVPVHEDSSSKNKDEEWQKLIVEKGSALLGMLKDVDFELHVQEPFLSQLKDGLKTIEGRCAVGDYRRITSGHILLFNKFLKLQVQDVKQYASFHEMLETENLAKVLPGVSSIEEGVQIYRNFYSEEKERSNGVLAIGVKTLTSQLYVVLASMLSGLGYEGVQRLLCFAETVGTNPELLPPPRSTLLSAFFAPHNPDVKGSVLTSGARALAKHVNRSSERYWGDLHGNDTQKNKNALSVISRLLNQSCWLNLHILPPHGTVFEIRNRDGYGARWSADGTKDFLNHIQLTATQTVGSISSHRHLQIRYIIPMAIFAWHPGLKGLKKSISATVGAE